MSTASEERDQLEMRLEALRAGNPAMPPGVERRIRARLATEARRPARSRRIVPRPPSAGGLSAGPLLLLIGVLLLSGWVVTHTVLPILHDEWNGGHCADTAGQAAAAAAPTAPAASHCPLSDPAPAAAKAVPSPAGGTKPQKASVVPAAAVRLTPAADRCGKG